MIRGWLIATALAAALAVSTPAEAARTSSLVIDAVTGQILSANNPDLQNYPASLTKMMTLYLTFEALEAKKLKLDQKLPVSSHAAGQAPSKLGLVAGGSILVEDAIRGIAVKSANDAAVVMGEALGGTEPRFAQRMTAKAQQLGMAHTQFRNASGLPNRGQVSTARDIATLALALRRDYPKYFRYFSEQQFAYRGTTHHNHNHLLGHVPGVDGVKTGYIRASGFNIAISAERGGRRLIAVVLGGSSPTLRDQHVAELIDQGFATAQAKGQPGLRLRAADLLPLPRKAAAQTMAAMPPDEPAAGVADLASAAPLPSEWAVQVGAFTRAGPAQLALKRVAQREPLLRGRPAAVLRGEGDDDDNELYRARFVGLTESDARSACAHLKKQRVDCVVVPVQDDASNDAHD